MTPDQYKTATPSERRAFWRTNLLAAKDMMERIDASKVDLDYWRREATHDAHYGKDEPGCGTIACLGGWCTWEPHFRALGVRSDSGGEPGVEGAGLWPGEVAGYLFGNEVMFGSAARSERYPDVDPEAEWAPSDEWEQLHGPAKVSDHAIALNRISAALAPLEAQP